MQLRASAVLALLLPALTPAAPPKKVVYVNSYHRGFEWSDGEQKGAAEVLQANGVALAVFYLDAKRDPDPRRGREMGRKAKAFIDAEKPDAVIVADDQAVEYVLAPHYRDAALPFVFCGVNWDASHYGLPYRNTTGMVEVNLTKPLAQALRQYARGDRLGFLSGESDAGRKDVQAYREMLGMTFAVEKFVTTMADWKASYAALQDQVDILILYGHPGIADWREEEALAWVNARARIPSGTIQHYMAPFADMAMAKVPSEQGAWAANSALAIMGGISPASIAITQNKEANLILNVKHASRLGIAFKPELTRVAQLIK
jgi:ABC-type uncharacterized transport system substrate-binding protein